MLRLIVAFLVAFLVLSCQMDELPFAPMGGPATKMTVAKDSCFVIQWDCDPSMWMTEADSVYSIFYQTYRFQARGSAVILTEYIDSNSKRVYEAHPTLSVSERNRARFQWTDDGKCGLWSDAIRDTTVAVRVFKGDVQWRYRALPNHSQYAVKEDGMSYKIAKVNEDTTLRYVDFYSFHDRLNAPPSLVGKRYYLPTNFSKSALDTLLQIPNNDSLYIESPFRCEDDENCAEWPEAMCPEPEPVVVKVAAGTEDDSGVEAASSVVGPSSPRVPHKGHCNFSSTNLGSTNFGYPCDPDGIAYPHCVSPTVDRIDPGVDCRNYALKSNEGGGLRTVDLGNGDTAKLTCGDGATGTSFNNGRCCPASQRFNNDTKVCEPSGETRTENYCSFGSDDIAYRCNYGGFDPGFPTCALTRLSVPLSVDCGNYIRVESGGPGIASVTNDDGTTYYRCRYGSFTNFECCPAGQTFNVDTQACE